METTTPILLDYPIPILTLTQETIRSECLEGGEGGGEDGRKEGGGREAAPPVSCILGGIQTHGAEQAGQGLGFARYTSQSHQTTDKTNTNTLKTEQKYI
ncbi:hypothetical protein PHYPO_G00248510 [Pangasianodon hypophthalmus]|uniref:Uncharacterized protein n=1 Tax=Pangasianodon hypophthalmus TaxID=310915 RepID=A0A5N5JCU4_PANHP|nr:hypothetical protein PHYPO_G00248510 [Pangasianodon hypophthalmus]